MNKESIFVWTLVGLQLVCCAVVLSNFAVSVFGLRSIGLSWKAREGLEILASLGLLLGAILSFRMVMLTQRKQRRADDALRSISGSFTKVVDEKMATWGFTKAEHDVAWFSIKGFSAKEIAGLRGSSEGTIKAQNNAIYRKAGVTGRAQFLTALVDDLLDGGGITKDK